MLANTTNTALDDIEFLARSKHRVTVLDALAEGPRSRADLQAVTGASASTLGRLLGEFENRRWIRKDGHQYRITQSGSFVTDGMREVIERIDVERKLRDVCQWLPSDVNVYGLGMGPEAVVTTAEFDDPYRPVNRFVSLLRETGRFRFVGADLALLEPCKDDLRRQILDGMRTEIIDPPSSAAYIRAAYREHCSAPLESGNLTVWLHDDLPPYGVSIFDERIGISCHDPDSGTARVLIDTDTEEARTWAEATFASYRQEARRLELEPGAE